MSGNLYVNTEAANTTGNMLTEKAEVLKSKLDAIYSCNEEIKTSFLGSDAAKYTNAVDEMKDAMYSLQTTINKTGIYLQEVSAAYAEARSINESAIQG